MLRRKTIKVASQVLAKSGVLKTLNRSNAGRGGVILVFHEISFDALSIHLSHLAELYRYVALDEFVKRLSQGKSTVGLAAITFDDGVQPVTEAAARLAQARGWPMTCFLPTRYLDTREPYWFLELDPLLKRAMGRSLKLNGRSFSLDRPTSIVKASNALRRQFKTLSTEGEVDQLLRTVRQALFGSEERPIGLSVSQPIAWSRVQQLAARDELAFEAHSVNHLALSRITEDKLIKELEGSRARIEEITGRQVRHFCYPYGGPNEIGTFAPQVVRKLFHSGTTTSRGRCSAGLDLALLPRVPLDEDDSEEVVAFKVAMAR